jgi:hypothetical protein
MTIANRGTRLVTGDGVISLIAARWVTHRVPGGLIRAGIGGPVRRRVTGGIAGLPMSGTATPVDVGLIFGRVGGLTRARRFRRLFPLAHIWPRLHNPDSPRGRAAHGHLGTATRGPAARFIACP